MIRLLVWNARRFYCQAKFSEGIGKSRFDGSLKKKHRLPDAFPICGFLFRVILPETRCR